MAAAGGAAAGAAAPEAPASNIFREEAVDGDAEHAHARARVHEKHVQVDLVPRSEGRLSWNKPQVRSL